MDPKQPHLNGAYYGPAVPPQSYNRIGRRSSCGPCSCLCSLLKLLVAIVVILGILVLVLWLVFRPNEITVYVTSASLSQFALSPANSTLSYNLTLDVSIRNPNRKIGIYYDSIEARALYDGSRFGYVPLQPFYQGHKTTTDLFPVFQGQGVVLGDSVSTTYNREKGEGSYYVDVKLYTSVRLKVSIFKIRTKPEIDCTLRLPVPGKGSSAPFDWTKCDVNFF